MGRTRFFWQTVTLVIAITVISMFYAAMTEAFKGNQTMIVVAAVVWVSTIGFALYSDRRRRG